MLSVMINTRENTPNKYNSWGSKNNIAGWENNIRSVWRVRMPDHTRKNAKITRKTSASASENHTQNKRVRVRRLHAKQARPRPKITCSFNHFTRNPTFFAIFCARGAFQTMRILFFRPAILSFFDPDIISNPKYYFYALNIFSNPQYYFTPSFFGYLSLHWS